MRRHLRGVTSGRSAKTASAALVVACLALQLAAPPARAYVVTPEPPATGYAMNLNLGSSVVSTIGYGNTTWNALAADALNVWNQTGIGPGLDHNFFSVTNPAVVGDPCARDGVNEVRWSGTLCGVGFGDALAVTQAWIVNGKRVEEDVLFNNTLTWDAYPGPLRPAATGGLLVDFYRVALHEFGHAVGLDHPDEFGQPVSALMNSQISAVNSLQPDDVAGAHAIAWPPTVGEIKPDFLSFAKQADVALNVPVISNTVAVSGYSAAVPISVTGGEYSIGGGPFTGAAGAVSNGQGVRLRVTSSSAYLTAITAVLMINGVRSEFTVITPAGPTPVLVDTSSYLPLVDGGSWTYEKNGVAGHVRTILSGFTLVNGVNTKAEQDSEGGIGYYTNDGSGIRQHRYYDPNVDIPGYGYVTETDTFTPPYVFAPSSATLGQGINNSGAINVSIPQFGINSNLSYTGISTPEAFEVITVPAGTFNTIRMHATLDFSGFIEGEPVSGTGTEIFWVASNVGVVKQVSVSDGVVDDIFLLTGYSVPLDTQPDPFSFTAQTGAPLNAWVVSGAVTISGISAPASIGVSGGEYSIDGGPFTTAAGGVTAGQTIRVRVMSAASYGATAGATLTVGTASATFSVTTLAAPMLSAVLINGPTVVAESGSGSYSASAVWSDGAFTAITPAWSSSNPAIAAIDASGIVTAAPVVQDTAVRLTATYTAGSETMAGSFTLTVADSASTLTSQAHAVEPGFNLLGNGLNGTINVPAIFGGPGNPVAGVTENVVSVWRWNALLQRWGFYSPLLTAEQNAAYAISQGYELLISIQPGEGFWVNISGQVTLPLQAGSPAGFAFSDFDALPSGFNLITIGQEMTPTEFNNSVAQAAPPAEGAAMTANFTSLWVWDAARQKWYFYSPILEASGGLPAVSSYATGQGFLHFQDYGKTLGAGTGFWVNK